MLKNILEGVKNNYPPVKGIAKKVENKNLYQGRRRLHNVTEIRVKFFPYQEDGITLSERGIDIERQGLFVAYEFEKALKVYNVKKNAVKEILKAKIEEINALSNSL